MIKIRFEKHWKNELINTANYILKLYTKKINVRKAFTLEKKIMLCLLHLRQYKEYYFNKKRNYPNAIQLAYYPIEDIKKNEDDIGRRYNLFKGAKEELKLNDLCDFFIHIDIKSDFIPLYGIYGTFFANDRNRNKKLFYINLVIFSEIFLSLAKNEEIGINIKIAKNGTIEDIKYTNKWKINKTEK